MLDQFLINVINLLIIPVFLFLMQVTFSFLVFIFPSGVMHELYIYIYIGVIFPVCVMLVAFV